MPRRVNQDTGNLRHGGHAPFFRGLGIHLVSTHIGHPVGSIPNLPGVRIVPAVTLNQTNTVGSPDAQIICPDEILIRANSIRQLLELRFQQVNSQHLPKGTHDIAPFGVIGRNRPLHQIQIVLRATVHILRGINSPGTDIAHDVGKVLNDDVCAKGCIDIGNKLVVRLFCPETGNQPGHKSRLAGIIIQRHYVQRLSCTHFAAQFRVNHGEFNFRHGIFHAPQKLKESSRS